MVRADGGDVVHSSNHGGAAGEVSFRVSVGRTIYDGARREPAIMRLSEFQARMYADEKPREASS